MDPQIKSIMTSVGLAISTAAASLAASRGLIPAADTTAFANDIVTFLGVVGTLAFGWWKAHEQSQTSMIAKVNSADNGVKVVAANAPVPQVNAPIAKPVTK